MINIEDIKTLNIPKHIAIVPDGDRRWARERGLPTALGHKKGGDNFEEIANVARELGIKCITAWIFSTENWKRSKEEIDQLFGLVRTYIDYYTAKCLKDQIKFVHIGRKDRLPKDIIEKVAILEEKSKHFEDFTMAIAADYGGIDEILRATQKTVDQKLDITRENIEKNLDTANLPKLDLIIRTSGELRLSGFMTWQSEYAELYFTPKYFPDFTKEELFIAIESYSKRNRRFGGDTKK